MKKIISLAIIVFIGLLLLFLIPSRKANDTLVAYFSATGNTKAVAERLASAIHADLFEIVPEQLYTAEDLDWRNQKSRSSTEMIDRNSRPIIATDVTDMAKYKTIFIGFPIWWGREPAIIDTFIESYNLSGKTIVPFATSGSTPNTDEAAADIRLLAPKANVMNGKRFPVNVQVTELKTGADEFIK